MTTRPRPSAQQRTTDSLRTSILAGRWTPGDRLPPERTLSGELGVSRLTLRSSLATLASEGLVRSRQGSGIEVLDYCRTGSIDLFTWLLSLPGEGGEQIARWFEEIVGLRRLVALDTLVRAAGRAKGPDVAALETLAARQAERVGNPPLYLEGDREYQRRIIRIAGSIAVELLFNSFERVLEKHRELTLIFVGPLERHLEQYALVHQLLRSDRPEAFRALAETALDLVEAEGLRRVRDHLERRGQ